MAHHDEAEKASLIRASVIGHLQHHKDADYGELVRTLKDNALPLERGEVKSVVIPMIASGTLKYGTNLRIQLATKKRQTKG